MATWAKIKFFYDTQTDNLSAGLTATSTASTGDYDVGYLINMLETNTWKSANTIVPMYITYDAGSVKSADYVAIIGHNLNTAGATVTLQYSTDSFAADVNDAFTVVAITADTVYLKEFTSQSARFWRLKITGTLSAAPYMAICIWGDKTELDYATASFDPHSQSVKANVNITQGGYMAGTHTRYVERSLSLSFADADSILYDKVKTWWETSGSKNFFVAWETANSPADVYFMRPGNSFNNPLANSGAYRNISVNLKGRKE